MTFQVIIPVVNVGMFDILVRNILSNSIYPSSIIIINNSTEHIEIPKSSKTKFIVINPPNPLFVNESWNLGISYLTDCDFVSILNDDLEIPLTFFERITKGFKTFPDAGVICPCTVTHKVEVDRFELVNKYVKMRKKEGWAFTIRKDILDTIPPVHPELELFFGDDWFWWYVYRGGSGYVWYKDCGMVVYHAVGTSLRKLCSTKRNTQKGKERKIWYDLKTRFIENGTFRKN